MWILGIVRRNPISAQVLARTKVPSSTYESNLTSHQGTRASADVSRLCGQRPSFSIALHTWSLCNARGRCSPSDMHDQRASSNGVSARHWKHSCRSKRVMVVVNHGGPQSCRSVVHGSLIVFARSQVLHLALSSS